MKTTTQYNSQGETIDYHKLYILVADESVLFSVLLNTWGFNSYVKCF